MTPLVFNNNHETIDFFLRIAKERYDFVGTYSIEKMVNGDLLRKISDKLMEIEIQEKTKTKIARQTIEEAAKVAGNQRKELAEEIKKLLWSQD
jgi:hypothetical protein